MRWVILSVRISNVEKKILLTLNKMNGEGTAEKIAENAKLKTEQVVSSIESLVSKGLIKAYKDTVAVYSLTKEGKSYVKKGLPEKRLIKAILEKRDVTTKDLKRETIGDLTKSEMNIGLNWARKNGWLIFEKMPDGNTKVFVSEGGQSVLNEKTDLEELLEIIEANKEMKESDIPSRLLTAVKLAKQRNLIQEKKVNYWTLILTEQGKEALESLKKAPEIVTRLTRKIIISGAWRKVKFQPYNIQVLPPAIYPGKKHPYTVFLEKVRKILIGMGFVEAKGPLVEAEFWNFDALYQAQDHPAREIHDSYVVKTSALARIPKTEYVKNVMKTHENGWITGSTGWGYKWSFDIARRLILRTQGTAISARTLASGVKPPHKMFAIAEVFRPDVIDKTHSMEFQQCEGIVVAEGLTLKHLLGYLAQFAKELGFEKVKFKPGYFPFTEPSVEAFVYHEKIGWMEVLGAGLFRPEVIIPAGYEYPKIQVLAWGIGIGRLAMAMMDIDDIRHLHSPDLQWLREKPLRW